MCHDFLDMTFLNDKVLAYFYLNMNKIKHKQGVDKKIKVFTPEVASNEPAVAFFKQGTHSKWLISKGQFDFFNASNK